MNLQLFILPLAVLGMSASFTTAQAKKSSATQKLADFLPADRYPTAKDRTVSPGNTTYYLDPQHGKNDNSGLEKSSAWKTFSAVNAILLAPGDRVEIVTPGRFDETLMLMGAGSAENPVVVSFAKGRYDLFREYAAKVKYHISNTNSDPYTPKAIGLYFKDASHFKIEGGGAQLFFRGKMIEVCIDNSKNITINNLHLDYHRPTVSEFTALSVSEKSAIIEIHKDSTYKLNNGRITWIGEGWELKLDRYSQEHDPMLNKTWRTGRGLMNGYKAEQLDGRKLKLTFPKKTPFTAGHTYQHRNAFRDCVGVFQVHSKDILWTHSGLHFLHGMGVVSQFTENITFDHVQIAPRKESGRTCAAWADMLHFSGCKGQITIKNVTFSGANDDAINVHGTHLAIMDNPEANKVLVAFKHRQTFGFQPFFKGDEIEFIRQATLTPYSSNKVVDVERKNDKEFLLTLEKPAPDNIAKNDAIENVTWTPDVKVSHCKIYNIPTRGFLLTTRGKVVIENNYFHRTRMPAILIEDDARGWFESGYVTDMLIQKNQFFECAPIHISPKTKKHIPGECVHSNIRIIDNTFITTQPNIVSAQSVKNLTVTNNHVKIRGDEKLEDARKKLVHHQDCTGVKVEANQIELHYQGK